MRLTRVIASNAALAVGCNASTTFGFCVVIGLARPRVSEYLVIVGHEGSKPSEFNMLVRKRYATPVPTKQDLYLPTSS
ncbi:unnamed protein product [Schistosoma mattheei]|uniref:Uncharacterized protein n=1 Tax=Schistosoma mattheei TaxID=31246 RepID=A0A183Q6E6_9TREM|nr:unnamed protein product [Schistosoma mattheei]